MKATKKTETKDMKMRIHVKDSCIYLANELVEMSDETTVNALIDIQDRLLTYINRMDD